MNLNKHLRFGDVLVKERMVSSQELKQMLSIQKERKTYKPLGEIGVEMKFFSRTELNRVLNKYKSRIKLGELLINLGHISKKQLNQSLKLQKSTNVTYNRPKIIST